MPPLRPARPDCGARRCRARSRPGGTHTGTHSWTRDCLTFSSARFARVIPSFIVDVSEFAEGKMNAIRAHASQFYSAQSNEPTTRISEQGFLKQIEDRMRYYG